jgi:hypothetical protein
MFYNKNWYFPIHFRDPMFYNKNKIYTTLYSDVHGYNTINIICIYNFVMLSVAKEGWLVWGQKYLMAFQLN